MRIKSESGHVQLEAYKSVGNDQINNLKACRQFDRQSQLFWVSIGIPTLVRISLKGSNLTLFPIDSQGFFTAVEMLTDEQAEILAQSATEKYGIKIQPKQIVHLILAMFECKVSLIEGGQKYLMKGRVRYFRKFPLRLEFEAEIGTIERKLFEEKISKEDTYSRVFAGHAGKGNAIKTFNAFGQ